MEMVRVAGTKEGQRPEAKRPAEARRPRLLYLVTEDWYFCSHRLPMARAARDAGFDVVVATRVNVHGEQILSEGFHLHPLTWRRRDRGPASLFAVLMIARLYRRIRPDLVHHVALKSVVFGSLAARLVRVPAMVNALTGLGYVFIAKTLRARLLRLLITQALRFLIDRPRSRVLLQNADDLQVLLKHRAISGDRVTLIRGSGIDATYFSPLPPPPKTTPIICALVGRMVASKGVAVAVEALRIVRAKGVDVELQLVGMPDPENPDSIGPAQLTAWAEETGIRWLGHVADVREVWRHAHIAVLPSAGGEGLPKSLLEAAACARPIVASDVPGCREIVVSGVNGERVPPSDPDALAAAVMVLVRDPARRCRYGAAGRRMVESDLSAEAVGRQAVTLYRNLLS